MIVQSSNDNPVCCSKCGTPVSGRLLNAPTAWPCTHCRTELQVEVFPALFAGSGSIQVGDALLSEGEAGCFFHPGKRAVVACGMCGRFLCALCDIPLAGQRLCPTCVELGRSQGRLTELITHRTLYDQIALSLSIIPLLIFWLTIVTGPIALYVAVRHWKSPTSLLPRTKVRFLVAILMAGLQVMGWVALLAYLVT